MNPHAERTIAPLSTVLVALLLLLPLAAAQEDAATEDARAGLRIAHIVPEGTTVDVLIDGETRVASLAPATVSRYVFLAPGEHEIEIVSRAALGGNQDGTVGAETVDPEGAADPAAPADAAPADAEPAAPAQDPAGPPATEDPGTVEDTSLSTHTVDLQAEAYGTLILFRTAGDGADGDARATEDPEAPDAQATEEPGAPGDVDGDEAEATDDPGAPSDAEGGDAEATEEPGATADADDPAQGAAQDGAAPAEEGGAGLALQARFVVDPLDEFPGAGTSRVRVVHAAPNAGPVTVVAARAADDDAAAEAGQDAQDGAAQDEGPQDEAEAQDAAAAGDQPAQEGPAPIDGEPLASGLGVDEAGEYLRLRSGPHHLQVQVQDGTVAVDLDEVTFASGLVYTLYVGATDQTDTLVLTPAVDGGVSRQER